MYAPLNRSLILFLVALLTGLTLCASRTYGQERAVLELTVQTAADSVPLGGAQVLLKETGQGGLTNEQGILLFNRVGAGTWTLEVRVLGFRLWTQTVTLAPGSKTSVVAQLIVEPVQLKAVEVTGRDSNLARRGFFERKQRGVGTFLTRADIEALEVRMLSDVFRRYGVNVSNDARGRPPNRIRGQQTVGPCPVQFYVDGVPTAFYSADEMRPSDVEGVEIYRGAASIPTAFNRGTAACGVIVIWTKVD